MKETIEIGDTIVQQLSATGTMTGSYSGMPATGKRTTWTEIHIGRVARGRLVEHWGLVAPGEVPFAA